MSHQQQTNDAILFACELCGRAVTFPQSSCGRVEICPHCGEYIDVPHENDAPRENDIAADPSNSTVEPRDIEQRKARDAGSRTSLQLWLEVAAVICLAIMPYFISALMIFFRGYQESSSVESSIVERELSLIVHSLQVSMPLLLIMALTKEPWARFGISRPRWIIDVLGGCAIAFLAIIGRQFTYCFVPDSLLGWSHFYSNYHFQQSEGLALSALILLATLVDSFSEELVMRGYMIPRLETLLKSKGIAVFVSSLLFASYHLYQGLVGFIGSMAIGLVFGTVFCYWRRLWPLVAAHSLVNILIIFGR